MSRLPSIAFTAVLLLTGDIPGITQLRPANKPKTDFPATENIPLLPDMSSTGEQPASPQEGPSAAAAPTAKNSHLTEQSQLALVRFVDGEFARVVKPLPAGKNGFHLRVGAPLDQALLHRAVAAAGAAVNPGDTAQITRLDFKDREIVVDVNGGGRGKGRLRDHIHLELGGLPTVQSSAPAETVTVAPKIGATLLLDFDQPLPDMTPDDLKGYLAGMLDFSSAHSAAVQWIDTLPPQMKDAIKDKRAVVGMNREMVTAAMGRPDRKVRERDDDGIETEDWIYGTPPAKTIFVTFDGDKVVKVEQFPS